MQSASEQPQAQRGSQLITSRPPRCCTQRSPTKRNDNASASTGSAQRRDLEIPQFALPNIWKCHGVADDTIFDSTDTHKTPLNLSAPPSQIDCVAAHEQQQEELIDLNSYKDAYKPPSDYRMLETNSQRLIDILQQVDNHQIHSNIAAIQADRDEIPYGQFSEEIVKERNRVLDQKQHRSTKKTPQKITTGTVADGMLFYPQDLFNPQKAVAVQLGK